MPAPDPARGQDDHLLGVVALEWSVATDGSAIRDGVDSYLSEDGQIKVQTIHYSVVSTDLSVLSLDE